MTDFDTRSSRPNIGLMYNYADQAQRRLCFVGLVEDGASKLASDYAIWYAREPVIILAFSGVRSVQVI